MSDDYLRLDTVIDASVRTMPMRYYVRSWIGFLKHGDHQSQESSMYALRSHGYTVWGDGYGEKFRWLLTFEGKEYRIDPDVKEPWPTPESFT